MSFLNITFKFCIIQHNLLLKLTISIFELLIVILFSWWFYILSIFRDLFCLIILLHLINCFQSTIFIVLIILIYFILIIDIMILLIFLNLILNIIYVIRIILYNIAIYLVCYLDTTWFNLFYLPRLRCLIYILSIIFGNHGYYIILDAFAILICVRNMCCL